VSRSAAIGRHATRATPTIATAPPVKPASALTVFPMAKPWRDLPCLRPQRKRKARAQEAKAIQYWAGDRIVKASRTFETGAMM